MAESLHDDSYQKPKKPKSKPKDQATRARSSNKAHLEDSESESFDEERGDSEDLIDESSSYRA